MENKKAQGISISFIVVAAIAALVLVLVIAFATGGLSQFFGTIFGASEPTEGVDVKQAKTACTELCNNLKMKDYGAWPDSRYCTREYTIDIDGDGEINPDMETFHCYDREIGVECPFTKTDPQGTGISCNEDDCPTDTDPYRVCCGTGCKADTINENIDCNLFNNYKEDCDDLGCYWNETNDECLNASGAEPSAASYLSVTGNPMNCSQLRYTQCRVAEKQDQCDGWQQLEYHQQDIPVCW